MGKCRYATYKCSYDKDGHVNGMLRVTINVAAVKINIWKKSLKRF